MLNQDLKTIPFPRTAIERPMPLVVEADEFDRDNAALALIDMNGAWLDFDKPFEKLLGMTRGALLATSLAELTVERDRPACQRFLRQALIGDQPSPVLLIGLKAGDDRLVPVMVTASLSFPVGASRPFLTLQFRAQYGHQAVQRPSRRKGASAADLALAGAGLGTWHWSLQDQRLSVDARTAESLGLGSDAQQLSLLRLLRRIERTDLAGLREAMKAHLQGVEECFDRIVRLRKGSGGIGWALLRGRITRRSSLDGSPLQVSGTLLDVTRWKEMESRLQHLASTDDLTGLLNRRSGMTALEQALYRCEAEGGALSLVFLDVDHFKDINDQYGHDIGDQVLRQIAETLRQNKRDTDLAVRWGGEEFTMILPSTGSQGARAQADRLLASIAALTADQTGVDAVTASIGVVTRQPGESAHGLLRRADQYMYQAKQAGRARVVSEQSA